MANGNGSLHLVTGGSSGGGVSGVLLVQLKPETEVVISKGNNNSTPPRTQQINIINVHDLWRAPVCVFAFLLRKERGGSSS